MTVSTDLICPNCGAAIDFDSTFCTMCGAMVSVAPAEVGAGGARSCAHCNAPLEDDASFCIVCGSPVAPGEFGEPPAYGGGGRLCPACSSPVDEGDRFCIVCGAEVDDASYVTTPVMGLEPIAESPVIPAPAVAPAPAAVAPTSSMAPGKDALHVFDGNADDPEADREMKKHFHAPGNLG